MEPSSSKKNLNEDPESDEEKEDSKQTRTRRARKTPEQRAAERAAKVAAGIARPKKVKELKTEQEKIEEQARKEIIKASKSQEEKAQERLERRKKVEEVKAAILRDQARNNLPKNWPPTDLWRKIVEYLSYPQKAKLRGICGYFYRSFFDRQKWLVDSHAWLISQGFTSGLVFRLLGLTEYLPEPLIKGGFKREEIEKVIAETRNRTRNANLKESLNGQSKVRIETSPQLLRCLYKALQKKRKNFVDFTLVVQFYDEQIDGPLYRESLSKYYSENYLVRDYYDPHDLKLFSGLNLACYTQDALRLFSGVSPVSYLKLSLIEDNLEAFKIALEIPEEKMERLPENFFLDQTDLVDRKLILILSFFGENPQIKRKWFYPRQIRELLESANFFQSDLGMTDLVFYRTNSLYESQKIVGRYVIGKLPPIVRDYFQDYSHWQFSQGHPLFNWRILSRKPEMNPWREQMAQIL